MCYIYIKIPPIDLSNLSRYKIVMDGMIRKLKLKNIKRIHYSYIDIKGLVSRGEKGEQLNKKLVKPSLK